MTQIKVSRGDESKESGDDVTHILVIVLAIIVALGVLCLGVLLVLKRIRNQRVRDSNSPPKYNDIMHENGRNHQQLTIETRNGRSSVVLYNKDGQPMLANPNSPPHSPDNVPEIHITFPDDEDDSGKRKSGRVVVVRVGDNAAVGLEPLDEDELPAYEKDSNGSFYSIDMDDIGGLRDTRKEHEDYH